MTVCSEFPRWAGTEPQEADFDPDALTLAQLAEFDDLRAVAEALDEWSRERGTAPSTHGVGLFLELLAARGFRVEPIQVPEFADVLPAAVD